MDKPTIEDDRTLKLQAFILNLLMTLSHKQTPTNIVEGAATLNRFCQLLKTGNVASLGMPHMLDIPPTLVEHATNLLKEYGMETPEFSASGVFSTNIADVTNSTDNQLDLTLATLDITFNPILPSSST